MLGELIEGRMQEVLNKLRVDKKLRENVDDELGTPMVEDLNFDIENTSLIGLAPLSGKAREGNSLTTDELEGHSQFFLSIMKMAEINVRRINTPSFLLILSQNLEKTLNQSSLRLGLDLSSWAHLELLREFMDLSLVRDAWDYLRELEDHGGLGRDGEVLLNRINKCQGLNKLNRFF